MAREETKYRVYHQYGRVRKVYDSRPMALPKSTLVRRVDELGKEWQGDFGRFIFVHIVAAQYHLFNLIFIRLFTNFLARVHQSDKFCLFLHIAKFISAGIN